MDETTKKQDVNDSGFKSAAWLRMNPMWSITCDWWSSPIEIRAKGEDYLEKFKKEPPEKYARRKWNSVPINYFKDTIEGLAGVVFRADPKPTEAAKPIADLFGDIDLLGNSLHAFLLEGFKKGLRDGNGYFFVDAPPFMQKEDGTQPTLKDRENDRPWWIFYEAKQVINYQEISINGKAYWQKVTIETITHEPDGLYGEKEVKRHRVYTRGAVGENGVQDRATFEVLIEIEVPGSNTKKMVPEEGGEGELSVSEIPLIPIDDIESDPQLMTLLMLNILHYNKTSDFDDWCHMACVPTKMYKFDAKGDALEFIEKTKKQTISAGMADAIWGPTSDVKFVEVSGNGLDVASKRYQEVEQQILKIGGGMFAPSQVAPRSATEVMDTAGQRESKLAAYARKFENAVEKALYVTAEIINAMKGALTINLTDQEKSKLKLKLDLTRLTFSAQQAQLFSDLVVEGNLSRETFLQLLEKMIDMPEGWTVDEEMQKIASFNSTIPVNQIDNLATAPIKP